MPNFGFSAYLKLLCLSERARRTEILKRLNPREGGYDFHRSLKQAASRFLIHGSTLAEVLESTRAIVRTPERESAQTGLARLSMWRAQNPGPITPGGFAVFASPGGEFSVTFTADFALSIDGRNTAFHVWNNQRPPLISRDALGAMSLFAPSEIGAADDLAVLNLRQSQAYRVSQYADHSVVGREQALLVERTFRDLREELGLPPVRRIDRPSSPPLPPP